MFWYTGLGDLLRGNPQLLGLGIPVLTALLIGGVLLVRIAARESPGSWKILLLLSGVFGVGLAAYFTPGDVMDGDAHSHVARTYLFSDILAQEHRFPIWTNRWYFGYPFGLYYGFLYYLCSAAVSLCFRLDVFTATKVTLWTLHVLSGLAMFVFVRLITRSQLCALFAAIFYACSFQHGGSMLVSGYHILSLTYLLVPVFFIVCELFYQSRRTLFTASALAACTLCLLVFNHVQYGLYAVFAGCLWICIRFLLSRAHGRFVLLTLVFFALGSAWYLIPFVRESGDLVLSQSGMVTESLSTSSLAEAGKLFLWSRVELDHGYHYYYLGLTLLGLALMGVFRAEPSPAYRSLRSVLVLGTLLMAVLPRFVHVWLFFVCVLAGYGIQSCREYLERRGTDRSLAFSLLMVAVALDLGPTLIQLPYRSVDNSEIASLQERMDLEHEVGRILVLSESRSTLWRSLDVVGTNASSPFGGIPQCSTRTHPHVVALAARAAVEILDEHGELSETTREGLQLLNVPYVVVPSLNRTLRIAGAHPAWFSKQVTRGEADGSLAEGETWATIRNRYEDRTLDASVLDEVVRRMEPSSASPTAKYVLLHPGYSNEEVSALEAADTPPDATEFAILGTVEHHSSVRMDYRSPSDGYLYLAYSYFPSNRVQIDGKTVRAYRSAANFTVVAVPRGEHTLILKAGVSKLRRFLLYVAGATTVTVLSLALFLRWQRRPRHDGTHTRA